MRLISDAPTLKWHRVDVANWRREIGCGDAFVERARARSLAEPRRRAAFVRFADLVQQLGEPAAAQWLPPLPLGRPPEDHLIEWFEKSRDFLFSIPVEIRTLLCREGIEGVDVETMLADGARISGLQERLGPAPRIN